MNKVQQHLRENAKESLPKRKPWHMVYTMKKYAQVKAHNDATDTFFTAMLNGVRALHTTKQVLAFERDYRKDYTFDTMALHTFVTPNLYLELLCDYPTKRFYVAYDMQHCPFDKQVHELLRKWHLTRSLRHEPQKGGVKAFFDRVRAFQDDKYFTYR